MRALLAKLKRPWLFVRYIEEFGKNHVRKNEGQLYIYPPVHFFSTPSPLPNFKGTFVVFPQGYFIMTLPPPPFSKT